MRLHQDQRGQTLILVALSLPLILGFVGMATDVGLLFMDKRQIQTAADAAAIAGALNLKYGDVLAAGQAASTANGYDYTKTGVTVAVQEIPTWPLSNYYGQSGYVEATVSKTESTIFLALFGRPRVTVRARAVATNQGPGKGCIYTLGSSGLGMHIQGSAAITATDCGMYDNSDGSPAISQTGNGPNLFANFGSIGVVGTAGNVGNYSPTPVTGIAPVNDPLSYFPNYSCSGSSCGCSGTTTLPCTGYPYPTAVTCKAASGSTIAPGCYNGLSGNFALSAGTYLINGDISGGITGTGVTLILLSGSIALKGNTTATLAAPLASNDPGGTNPFDGILIYQVRSDATGADMKGTSNFNGQGVIYMPSASFEMEGNTGGTIYADFVVSSLDVQGNPTIHDYQALSGVSNPMTSISLVE